MTSVRDDITAHIRQVDGRNQLSAHQLGVLIAYNLHQRGIINTATADTIADFVEDANTGVGYLHPKRLTGPALADALVDRFDLDQKD